MWFVLFSVYLHSPFNAIIILDSLLEDLNGTTILTPIPSKIPSDVLKFEGKNGEDTNDHVMTCHSWFSLNSLHRGFFKLRLF